MATKSSAELNLVDELRRVISALDEEGVEYAMVGALALAVHGAPRATTDIDLMVRPEDVDRVLELVAPLGFDLPAAPMTFRNSGLSIQRITKIEGEETLMLDLLLVSDSLEGVWRSRTAFEAFDLKLKVISRAALIEMKAMAGRLRDLADIERLEEGDDDA